MYTKHIMLNLTKRGKQAAVLILTNLGFTTFNSGVLFYLIIKASAILSEMSLVPVVVPKRWKGFKEH